MEQLAQLPILMLVLMALGTLVMTIAWYAHLRFKLPLLVTILVSWLIALAEYALIIPAIRLGKFADLTVVQLKAMHEVIGIVMFVLFAMIYLKEKLALQHLVGFALMAAGLYLLFGV